MQTYELAHDVALDIVRVADLDTLRRYADDESGNMSLDCYRSLVEQRGGRLTDEQWTAACEIIRERFGE